jgi:AhpD family alkylhydroperoxidase
MKNKPLMTRNTSTLLSVNFVPSTEFELLLEWVRLGASHIRKNVACVEEHRQSLRARGETEERLSALDQWRPSLSFTEREKAALNLSESISMPDTDDTSALILKDAGCYFSNHQIVYLTLAILAVNDWIDLLQK